MVSNLMKLKMMKFSGKGMGVRGRVGFLWVVEFVGMVGELGVVFEVFVVLSVVSFVWSLLKLSVRNYRLVR